MQKGRGDLQRQTRSSTTPDRSHELLIARLWARDPETVLDVHGVNGVHGRRGAGSRIVAESGREIGHPEIFLGQLTSIERDSAITQRKLAAHFGMPRGLANTYLRRCVPNRLFKVFAALVGRSRALSVGELLLSRGVSRGSAPALRSAAGRRCAPQVLCCCRASGNLAVIVEGLPTLAPIVGALSWAPEEPLVRK